MIIGRVAESPTASTIPKSKRAHDGTFLALPSHFSRSLATRKHAAVARTLVRTFAAGHRERRLTRVIVLKDGPRLRTLKDAADVVLTAFDRTLRWGALDTTIERLLQPPRAASATTLPPPPTMCSACYRFGICFEERRNFHAADPAHPMAAKAVVPRVPRDHAVSSDMRVPLT